MTDELRGTCNPDRLRTDDDAVAFVRDFVTSGKPAAAISSTPNKQDECVKVVLKP